MRLGTLPFLIAVGLAAGCSVFPDVAPVIDDKDSPIDAANDSVASDSSTDTANDNNADSTLTDAASAVETDTSDTKEDSADSSSDTPEDTLADGSTDSSNDAPTDVPTDTGDGCVNKSIDGKETDIDCGGGVCPKCKKHDACLVNEDCQSNNCVTSSKECG